MKNINNKTIPNIEDKLTDEANERTMSENCKPTNGTWQ
jgi:hypothetical protein